MADRITTATAAKRANVNVRTVRKWVASGAVKAVKVSGKIMVDVASLDSRLVKGETYRYARKSRNVSVRTDLFKVANEISVRARRVEPHLMSDVVTLVDSASGSGLIDWDNGFHYVPEIDQVRKWASMSDKVDINDESGFDPNGELSSGYNPLKSRAALSGIESIELIRFIEDVYKNREGIAAVTKPSFMAKMEREINSNGNGEKSPTGPRLATEKQLTTIANMWSRKQIEFSGKDLETATHAVYIVKGKEDGLDVSGINHPTLKDASSVIDQIFKAPWKPREEGTKPESGRVDIKSIEPGFYRNPTDSESRVIRVKVSRSGFPFAGYVDGEAYVRGLIKDVKPEWKISVDEIRAYGRETGMCMVCSRELTNPESIESGIGPVCEGRL